MAGVAIVAIPRKEDPVWQISSEKVPHLTLLFLDEAEVNAHIASVVDHVAHVSNISMHRFGLQVDRRGVLGVKQADVLFFDKINIKWLRNIRSYLLANPHIYAAHQSVEQFPDWIPHLTLGYPDSPARPDNREYKGLHWVEFDRIALWTGEYEGMELQLKDEFPDEEVSMSEQVEDFLAHFGIKGMKWGVRRDKASKGGRKQSSTFRRTDPEAKEVRRLSGRVIRRNAKKLSNDELKRITKRMELEKKYNDLQKSDGGKIKKGSKYVADLLGAVGKQAATEAAGGAARTYTATVVGRHLGRSVKIING